MTRHSTARPVIPLDFLHRVPFSPRLAGNHLFRFHPLEFRPITSKKICYLEVLNKIYL
jgi:hypothetical protein